MAKQDLKKSKQGIEKLSSLPYSPFCSATTKAKGQ
ncbi:hypothetical protein COLO4_20009 [Corchorus olitorius]|uniref:Uncharacterized protein n=1 Tax=Corchorus olitorius TaxID=93759 RepID=A0A1R3J2B6_9ROSI|nr:hypothetical protein COLO4_20009 [Corchorus olitorius]